MKKLLKNKIFIIIVIVVLSILLFFAGIYLLIYFSFKINGSYEINIGYNEKYVDSGIEFKYFNKILNKKVKLESNVDTKKLGSYKITYKIRYLFFDIKRFRKVNVFDKEPPTIELFGDVERSICPEITYEEDGYKAVDNYDGDITEKVKIEINIDKIIYSVSDTSGNRSFVERTLNRVDKESPSIFLKGSSTVYVKKGFIYNDAGYIVSDNCDSNVNVSTSSNLDINKDGKYTITYIATDSSNNKKQVTRNITVYSESGTGVIYLTFDDGPSSQGTTAQILDVLKDEGVKATFFVTGSGDDNLIRREYNEGHAIALHTNTHDYSYIYSNVDNYFTDLTTVQNRIYNIIGKKVYIMRFPGGSSNTVSNKYNKDIMNILKGLVIEKGYSYFDWNVSAEDAGGCAGKDASCVYNKVINGLSKSKQNIVLMHDTKFTTANAIRDIIRYAKSNGYIFKVIDENTKPVRFS